MLSYFNQFSFNVILNLMPEAIGGRNKIMATVLPGRLKLTLSSKIKNMSILSHLSELILNDQDIDCARLAQHYAVTEQEMMSYLQIISGLLMPLDNVNSTIEPENFKLST